MSWPVIASALILVLGPAQVSGAAKGVVVALMLGAVFGLNVPSFTVIQRAVKEKVPARFVSVLGMALLLRLVAAVVVAGLVW